jgi:hypothetical protein
LCDSYRGELLSGKKQKIFTKQCNIAWCSLVCFWTGEKLENVN